MFFSASMNSDMAKIEASRRREFEPTTGDNFKL